MIFGLAPRAKVFSLCQLRQSDVPAIENHTGEAYVFYLFVLAQLWLLVS
jgi:hypothetical protein